MLRSSTYGDPRGGNPRRRLCRSFAFSSDFPLCGVSVGEQIRRNGTLPKRFPRRCCGNGDDAAPEIACSGAGRWRNSAGSALLFSFNIPDDGEKNEKHFDSGSVIFLGCTFILEKLPCSPKDASCLGDHCLPDFSLSARHFSGSSQAGSVRTRGLGLGRMSEDLS